MRSNLRILFSLSLGLSLLSGLACAKSGKREANTRPTTLARKASPMRSGERKPEPKEKASIQRKVIHKADMNMAMARYEPFALKLRNKLNQLKGYTADLSLSRSLQRVSQVRATVRVPSQHFTSFLDWLRSQGRVTYERLYGEDITNQYYDMKSRLRNQQKLEQRILLLLKRSQAKLKDVIEVERELARIRGQIEQMQGQKKMWERLVAMATLNLTIRVESRYEPKVALTFGQKLKRALGSSWYGFTQFLEDLTLGIAKALPFWLFALLAFWFWRRRRRKKTAQAE